MASPSLHHAKTKQNTNRFLWTVAGLVGIAVACTLAVSSTLPLLTRVIALTLQMTVAALLTFRRVKNSVPLEEHTALREKYLRAVEGLESTVNLSDRGWRSEVPLDKRFEDAFALVSSALRESKATMADAAGVLASAQAQKAKLSGSIQKEVRAPLVQAITEIRDIFASAPDEALAARLTKVHRGCFQALVAVNDSLELGAVSAETLAEIRPVSFSGLCADVSELYAEHLKTKPEITLVFNLDSRLPEKVRADPKRLMHLVSNIIENAIENTEAGLIEVIIRPIGEGAVGTPMAIEISCGDQGRGISPERLSVIARELQSADKESHFEELGVGLRAVARIVKSLGGAITISARPKRGILVVAEIKLEIVQLAKTGVPLPTELRFFCKSQPLMVALTSGAFFHKVRPVPLSNPIPEEGSDTIFVDAGTIVSGNFGTPPEYKPKERFVVLIQQDQQRVREKLVQAGFKRFLNCPLVSTELVRSLQGKDYTPVAPQQRGSSSQRAALKVLVVDDVPAVRTRLVSYLRDHGHDVSEGSDGVDIVEYAKAQRHFDLIVTDLMMTTLDGAAAARQVRELEGEGQHRTTIVAMSAYAHAEQPESTGSEFDAMLRKPVNLDEIDQIVAKVVSKKICSEKPETVLIDLEDLRKRCAKKTPLVIGVLQSFIEDTQVKLSAMRAFFNSGDINLTAKHLHGIKGLLLEAGALTAAECARRLELQLKGGKMPANTELEDFYEVVGSVCKEAKVVTEALQKAVLQS